MVLQVISHVFHVLLITILVATPYAFAQHVLTWFGSGGALRLFSLSKAKSDSMEKIGFHGHAYSSVFEGASWDPRLQNGHIYESRAESRNNSDLWTFKCSTKYTCRIELSISDLFMRPRIRGRTVNGIQQSQKYFPETMYILREGMNITVSTNEWVKEHAPSDPSTNTTNLTAIACKLEDNIKQQLKFGEEVRRNCRQIVSDSLKVYGQLRIGLGESSVTVFHTSMPWDPPWLHFNVQALDITDSSDFSEMFAGEGSVDQFKMEHVLEHLTLAEAVVAALNCYQYLKPGGTLRIAVPDYNQYIHHMTANSSQSKSYSDNTHDCNVSIGICNNVLHSPCVVDDTNSSNHHRLQCLWESMLLSGEISRDVNNGHKVQYTVDSITGLLESVGFKVHPVEWISDDGILHIPSQWDDRNGRIDRRHSRPGSNSFSIIVDAIKPSLPRDEAHGSDAINATHGSDTTTVAGETVTSGNRQQPLRVPSTSPCDEPPSTSIPNIAADFNMESIGLPTSRDVFRRAQEPKALRNTSSGNISSADFPLAGVHVFVNLITYLPGRSGEDTVASSAATETADRQRGLRDDSLDMMWYWVVPLLAKEIKRHGGTMSVIYSPQHQKGYAQMTESTPSAPDSLDHVEFPVQKLTWDEFVEKIKSESGNHSFADRPPTVHYRDFSNEYLRSRDKGYRNVAVLVSPYCSLLDSYDGLHGLMDVIPLFLPETFHELASCVHYATKFHSIPLKAENCGPNSAVNLIGSDNEIRSRGSAMTTMLPLPQKRLRSVTASNHILSIAEYHLKRMVESACAEELKKENSLLDSETSRHDTRKCTNFTFSSDTISIGRLGYNIGELFPEDSNGTQLFKNYLHRSFGTKYADVINEPFVIVSGTHIASSEDRALEFMVDILQEFSAGTPTGLKRIWILVLGGSKLSSENQFQLRSAGLKWLQICDPVIIAIRRLAFSSALAFLHLPIHRAGRIGAMEIVNAIACGCPIITSDISIIREVLGGPEQSSPLIHYIRSNDSRAIRWLVLRDLIAAWFGAVNNTLPNDTTSNSDLTISDTFSRQSLANISRHFLGWFPFAEAILHELIRSTVPVYN